MIRVELKIWASKLNNNDYETAIRQFLYSKFHRVHNFMFSFLHLKNINNSNFQAKNNI